jgi:hypothetical protein
MTATMEPIAAESLFCTPSDAATQEPATIVLFGASGDLAKRKLLPGLWEVVTPVLDNPEAVQPYAGGSWGSPTPSRPGLTASLAALGRALIAR